MPRNRQHRPGIDRTEIAFLVCESGNRWRDTARRFVGPFQHANLSNNHQTESPVVTVRSTPLEKVRASLAGESSVAILWELSVENASRLSSTIAQIGSSRPDVLQLVAIHEDAVQKGAQLGIQIMEFGVRAVVTSPEEFAALSQLVHRRFANC